MSPAPLQEVTIMDAKRWTILIINNSREELDLLVHTLAQADYHHVQEANTIQQGLDILLSSQKKPDTDRPPVGLILLALPLATVGGMDICRTLQSSRQTADIPVLIITEAGNDTALQKILGQGVMGYITTPTGAMELGSRVKGALLLKETLDSRHQLACKLAEAQSNRKQLEFTDNLTGLANRRYFDIFFSQEWRRGRREKEKITLCLLDIDFFKAYSAGYGQDQADECLQKMATILTAHVKRPGDLVARYDTDKFAILLSGTSQSGACAVVGRIMATLATRNIPHEHSPISPRLTLSAGVAMLSPKASTSVQDLTSQTERALQEAKTLGRNQLSCPGLQAGKQP